jgi:hypothetical protein
VTTRTQASRTKRRARHRSPLDRFALRALFISAGLLLVSVFINIQLYKGAPETGAQSSQTETQKLAVAPPREASLARQDADSAIDAPPRKPVGGNQSIQPAGSASRAGGSQLSPPNPDSSEHKARRKGQPNNPSARILSVAEGSRPRGSSRRDDVAPSGNPNIIAATLPRKNSGDSPSGNPNNGPPAGDDEVADRLDYYRGVNTDASPVTRTRRESPTRDADDDSSTRAADMAPLETFAETSDNDVSPDLKTAADPYDNASSGNLDTEPETADNISSPYIARAQFTTGVIAREPIDRVESMFPMNDEPSGTLYYFTEVVNMSGETVTHIWEYEGQVIAEVLFEIGSDRWRTWSSKQLLPSMTGPWRVLVIDAQGNLLSTDSILYQGPQG